MPSFDFAPLVWWGLPAVAAPALIHLLSRLRHRRVRFAAMEFLLESQRRFRTRVLLRQVLLLALRTAGVAAVVLALAQPRWRQAVGGLLGGGGTHLVLLDDSYSMGDTTGGGDEATGDAAGEAGPATAFDRGRGAIERIAADLAASGGRHEIAVATTSALAAAEAEPPAADAFLVARRVVDPAGVRAVRESLAAARVSARAVGPAAAVAAAAAALSPERGERVLWIVSDVRARDWLRADEAVAALDRLATAGVTIRLVDCGSDAAGQGNLAIDRLDVAGGVPAAGVVLPVEIEVRNDGATAARDVMVTLEEDGGGRPGLTIDEIPPGGAAVRRFDVRFATRGSHTLEAALPADVLPADDVRAAAVEIVDAVDVLVIDGGAGDPSSDGFYVATALAPGSGAATGLRPRLEPPRALATLDLKAFDCLWLLDVERLDPAALAAVEAYVRGGGGVVFFCGPRTRPEYVNEVLHRDGAGIFPVPLAGAVDLLADASAATPPPDLVVEDHPVVAVLSGQRNPLVDAVRIERFMAIDRGHDPAAAGVRRMLSLRTGQPLAVERAVGAGRVAAVLTTAAPTWNNWARGNPSWVVVLLELENLLAARRRQAPGIVVGEPLAVRLEPGVDEIDVDFVTPPDGDVVRQAATTAGGGGLEARLPATTAAGVHAARWRRIDGTERERLFAVNVDPAEGRLERLDRERLDRVLAGVPVRYDRAASLAAGIDGGASTSLAGPLLVAAILLLLAEQAVACAAGYHPAFRRGG